MGLLGNNIDEGVNFADVSAASGDFEALPAGWYLVNVTAADDSKTTSAESKKYPNVPMLNIETTIQEGDYENRRLWNNFLLHPDFLGYLKSFLLGTGKWTEEEINSPGFDFDADDLVGLQLDVKINRRKAKAGPREGEYENNMVSYAPAGSKSAKSGGGNGDGNLLP